MSFVFVYGTLKREFPNHHLLPPARFVGECHTIEHFPLVVAGDWYSPVLIDEPGTGCEVTGELYSLAEPSLEALDKLEGVGTPLGYTRIDILVNTRDIDVWTYAKPRDLVSQIHEGPLSVYLVDTRYVPGEQRGQANRGFGTQSDHA